MLAMPLIIFLLVLTIQMHEFEKQVQAWDKEIRQQQEQIEELYDRQDPVEQTDMTDVYGCKSLYGTYDFPWNTMSARRRQTSPSSCGHAQAASLS